MTAAEFRQLALSIPQSVEAEHMAHPDFRIAGKIFASLGAPDDDWAMVKLTPEEQQAFVEKATTAFQPCTGAWGRAGYTNIHLPHANRRLVQSAVKAAARTVAAKIPKKKKRPPTPKV